MNKPINVEVEFDPSVLPEWTRRHPVVVERCRVDLGCRIDVCNAEKSAYKQHLIASAEHWQRGGVNQ